MKKTIIASFVAISLSAPSFASETNDDFASETNDDEINYYAAGAWAGVVAAAVALVASSSDSSSSENPPQLDPEDTLPGDDQDSGNDQGNIDDSDLNPGIEMPENVKGWQVQKTGEGTATLRNEYGGVADVTVTDGTIHIKGQKMDGERFDKTIVRKELPIEPSNPGFDSGEDQNPGNDQGNIDDSDLNPGIKMPENVKGWQVQKTGEGTATLRNEYGGVADVTVTDGTIHIKGQKMDGERFDKTIVRKEAAIKKASLKTMTKSQLKTKAKSVRSKLQSRN
ncbi:hypothetical protein [Vibrio rarus]|uniref:hypothetical protein n=1 Tax=Vibrio rarus TaxID=413403 RepID=UPI0021C2DEBA|nr:hypothetical protein [Vibrio rarus]